MTIPSISEELRSLMAEIGPRWNVYRAELVYRLGVAKRRTPPSLWLKGHNHTSIIAHMNTSEDALGRAILSFIDEHTLLRQ